MKKKTEANQTTSSTLRESATTKMQSGGLLTLDEVATLFDVAPAVVHKLPLPSIRLGRALRFDPVDVSRVIATSKEQDVPLQRNPEHINASFFGMRFFDETNGAMGYLMNQEPIQRIEWPDVFDAISAGKTVTIAPAGPVAMATAQALFDHIKASQAQGQ